MMNSSPLHYITGSVCPKVSVGMENVGHGKSFKIFSFLTQPITKGFPSVKGFSTVSTVFSTILY